MKRLILVILVLCTTLIYSNDIVGSWDVRNSEMSFNFYEDSTFTLLVLSELGDIPSLVVDGSYTLNDNKLWMSSVGSADYQLVFLSEDTILMKTTENGMVLCFELTLQEGV